MSQVLSELLSLLTLETIEQGIYRGQSQDLGFRSVFGGQVIGQALSAARETVNHERGEHSFHSYFLRPGDAGHPIVYDVEIVRDGTSISTRRVKAIQFGKPIFYLTASFQDEHPGFEHQSQMPKVPGPEGLVSELELARSLREYLPASLRDKLLCDKPIEIRPVEAINPLKPHKTAPERHAWVRANGRMPDEPHLHKCVLAYASDFGFLPTALQPHGRSYWQPGLQVATIDHSMWFHRPFRVDEWLLYSIDSPSASSGRGLVRGQIFDGQGRLVASTIQEGVIRERLGD